MKTGRIGTMQPLKADMTLLMTRDSDHFSLGAGSALSVAAGAEASSTRSCASSLAMRHTSS